MVFSENLLEWVSNNWHETYRLGEKLAQFLHAGDVVALSGELGTGKTVMIKGICNGLHVKEPVTSPSFTLVQEYSGRIPVFHFDFYRLEIIHEIEKLDLDYYFQMDGVCLIEWGEKGEPLLPKETLFIRIDRASDYEPTSVQKRQIHLFTNNSSRWTGLRS